MSFKEEIIENNRRLNEIYDKVFEMYGHNWIVIGKTYRYDIIYKQIEYIPIVEIRESDIR